MAEEHLSFEQTFSELEQKVQLLEAGNLPLDDMIALYERAMGLAQRCQDLLANAELRVRQVEAVAPAADDQADDLFADLDEPDTLPF